MSDENNTVAELKQQIKQLSTDKIGVPIVLQHTRFFYYKKDQLIKLRDWLKWQ